MTLKDTVRATESVIAGYVQLLQGLLACPRLLFDRNLHNALPTEGGVYRVLEKGVGWQSSLYVGKSGNLRERIYGNHFMGNRRASTLKRKLIRDGLYADEDAVKQYFKEQCLVQFLLLHEGERTHFEHFALSILRPTYND